MNIIEAIKARRSVKHFDPDYVITDEEVNQIVLSALESPTSFNIQHWRLIQVKDASLRQKMRQAAWDQAQVSQASLHFVLCADVDAWKKTPTRYWRNAPSAVQDIVVPMIEPFYQGKDQLQRDEAQRTIGIVAQTMMLTVKAMGYDSCPMIGFDADKIAELINLPDSYIVGLLMAIGKASEPAWPKPGQLGITDVLKIDKFESA